MPVGTTNNLFISEEGLLYAAPLFCAEDSSITSQIWYNENTQI